MMWCSYIVEEHHIIFRSQNKQLVNCNLNKIYLCYEHHRGTYGVHGSKGAKLDRELKLRLQNKLEILWDKHYLTYEDIQQVLQINDKALMRLCKALKMEKGVFNREEVIRSVMGGKLILEGGGNK